MTADYNKGNYYFGDVEVTFVYKDDEEPEAHTTILEGIGFYESDIRKSMSARFTPIDILEIRALGTAFGEPE